jgi:hypothetical protein
MSSSAITNINIVEPIPLSVRKSKGDTIVDNYLCVKLDKINVIIVKMMANLGMVPALLRQAGGRRELRLPRGSLILPQIYTNFHRHITD